MGYRLRQRHPIIQPVNCYWHTPGYSFQQNHLKLSQVIVKHGLEEFRPMAVTGKQFGQDPLSVREESI